MSLTQFHQGYRDALKGDEWIKEGMSSSYYEGVAKAKRELFIINGK